MRAVRLAKRIINKTKVLSERAYVRFKYKHFLYPTELPKQVRIDASTICQLRCEGCGFQKSDHRGLGGGFLSADNFRKFLDDNPQIERVELSNYGEIFLNPELIDIMKCAYEKNVALEARMGVNFNTVTDEQLRALVDYQFRFISLSIDGASQESYAKYRRGGDFNTVINNVKKLQRIKSERDSKYPELLWQFVLTEYDEKDIPKAKEMAKNLGIPIFFKLNFMGSYKPSDAEFVKAETGLDCVTRQEYMDKYKKGYTHETCCQLFNDPQINWDGRLLGCCMNENGFNINVFEIGLKKALISDEYVAAKESTLMKNINMKRYSKLPCRSCNSRLAVLNTDDLTRKIIDYR